MQKKKSAALKLGLSAVAALALTVGGVAPAFAANIQIGPGDVAPNQRGGTGEEADFNYDQWHIGSEPRESGATLEDSVTFQECSISTLVPTAESSASVVQVLKGFPVGERPTTDGTTAPLEAVVNSTSITVLTGSVTIQVPMFIHIGGNPEDLDFTTYRSVPLGPGTYNLADLEITDSSDWPIGTNFAETFEILQSFIEDDDHVFQILGVGFTGSEGAVVESISFSGNTYFFGTGSCLPAAGPGAATPPVKIETAAA